MNIFLLCAALLAPGCFFDSDPVFLPDSDTPQDETQDGEDAPQDEPEGVEEEEGVQPDLPGEPDSVDVPAEDVAPPDFIPDFPVDDLPVDIWEVLPGACGNLADQAILATVDVRAEATTCAVGCLNDVDCITDCIVEHTGLSMACSACYAQGAMCIMENCLSPCTFNPESQECLDCLEASGCVAEFEACSGMTDF